MNVRLVHQISKPYLRLKDFVISFNNICLPVAQNKTCSTFFAKIINKVRESLTSLPAKICFVISMIMPCLLRAQNTDDSTGNKWSGTLEADYYFIPEDEIHPTITCYADYKSLHFEVDTTMKILIQPRYLQEKHGKKMAIFILVLPQ